MISMEQHRIDVLKVAGQWPAFGSSQLREALGGKSSPQVTPVLDWLTRHGYVKRLDPVYGPQGWERAWAVTELGRNAMRQVVAA